MKSIILLSSNENTAAVETEEQNRFIRSILETLGLPIDELWDEAGVLSIGNKIKLRSILSAYSIQIIDTNDGEMQIYCEGTVIAKFHKPEYILKKDLKQIDPKKRLYLEMKIDNWSIFDAAETEV